MSAPESVTIRLPKGALAGWPVLIHALRMAEKETGLYLVFSGLVEQIEAQTAPTPAEPTGLGAVVQDAHGMRWTRARNQEHDMNWRAEWGGRWSLYADLDAAKVLSEGVTP